MKQFWGLWSAKALETVKINRSLMTGMAAGVLSVILVFGSIIVGKAIWQSCQPSSNIVYNDSNTNSLAESKMTLEIPEEKFLPKSSALKLYYYYDKSIDNSDQTRDRFVQFVTMAEDIDSKEMLTQSLRISNTDGLIPDSGKDNNVLIIKSSTTSADIYSFDVSPGPNREMQKIFTFAGLSPSTKDFVSGAQIIDDGKSLAIMKASRGENYDGLENIYLYVYRLDNAKQAPEKYFITKKAGLYSSVSVLTYTADGQLIYLNEQGGDAGSIWSKWYRVNRANQQVEVLADLPKIGKNESNPTVQKFSPDNKNLAYIDYSTVINPADIDQKENWNIDNWDSYIIDEPSIKAKYSNDGGIIMVKDLTTGAEREIFRDLDNPDNSYFTTIRKIMAIDWIDNSHLAFETVYGVYVIDINSGKYNQIFTFEESNDPGHARRPYMISVKWPFILFADHSIARIGTNRTIQLPGYINTTDGRQYLNYLPNIK